jgi:hypothetical protein
MAFCRKAKMKVETSILRISRLWLEISTDLYFYEFHLWSQIRVQTQVLTSVDKQSRIRWNMWYSRYIAAEHVKFFNNYSKSINTYALDGFNLKYLLLDQQVQNKLAVKVSKFWVSDVDRIKLFSTPAIFMTQKMCYRATRMYCRETNSCRFLYICTVEENLLDIGLLDLSEPTQ